MNTGLERRATDISGQQKNLLIAEPIARLEADNNVRARMLNGAGAGDARLDLRLIALSMLDHIMEETAFNPGAVAEAVVEVGKATATRMNPQLSDEAADAVARCVFDHIRNAAGKYRAFQVAYHDAVEGVWRTHSFRYVETISDPDDTTVSWIRLSDGGKKLLLGMLDVADDLIEQAERVIMTKAIERERYHDALVGAARARARSADFRQSIDTKISRSRRDWKTVNMQGEVLPMLDAALDHVRERISEDQKLVGHLDDKIAELSDFGQRDKAIELRNTLQDCLSIHGSLFRRLTSAHDSFRTSMLRGLRPVDVATCRDPEGDVLMPLLAAPIGKVAAHAELIARCFSSAVAPRVLDIRLLLQEAVMEVLEGADGADEEADADFVPLDPPAPLFTPERIGVVSEWLERQTKERDSYRLSETIEKAANEDFAADDLRLLVLLALRPMSVAGSLISAEGPRNGGFSLDGDWKFGDLGGDDIVFHRAA